MTDTIEPMERDEDEKQQLAQRLVDQARVEGVDLVGPGGLLTGLTKTVLLSSGQPADALMREAAHEGTAGGKHSARNDAPPGRRGCSQPSR
jgi:hypothetical protein